MTWRDAGRLTGRELAFLGGVLVGLCVAALAGWAGVLAAVNWAVGRWG